MSKAVTSQRWMVWLRWIWVLPLACLAGLPLLTQADGVESQPPILLAAGDIADCGPGAETTARLLDGQPGLILALGDLAYPSGSDSDFLRCFVPTWGHFRNRLRAVPGNHDYYTPKAAPYFAVLGDAAGPAGQGFYSLDVHGWHLIALNTHLPHDAEGRQLDWLRQDLAATESTCILAFFHLPPFSSGEGGTHKDMETIWRVLTRGGVSVVLTGHDHFYERFSPLDTVGNRDDQHGVRLFIVGTGGASLDRRPWWTARHSETLISGHWGVLKMELATNRYRWSFITADGKAADTGEGLCRGRGGRDDRR